MHEAPRDRREAKRTHRELPSRWLRVGTCPWGLWVGQWLPFPPSEGDGEGLASPGFQSLARPPSSPPALKLGPGHREVQRVQSLTQQAHIEHLLYANMVGDKVDTPMRKRHDNSALMQCRVLGNQRPTLNGPTNGWKASLIAQLVKNLPAVQETPVRFLGQEDPLEKG